MLALKKIAYSVTKPFKKCHVQAGVELIGRYFVYGASYCIDCKTVGFFLKISKEIGKAGRESLTRAKRASLTRPTGV